MKNKTDNTHLNAKAKPKLNKNQLEMNNKKDNIKKQVKLRRSCSRKSLKYFHSIDPNAELQNQNQNINLTNFIYDVGSKAKKLKERQLDLCQLIAPIKKSASVGLLKFLHSERKNFSPAMIKDGLKMRTDKQINGLKSQKGIKQESKQTKVKIRVNTKEKSSQEITLKTNPSKSIRLASNVKQKKKKLKPARKLTNQKEKKKCAHTQQKIGEKKKETNKDNLQYKKTNNNLIGKTETPNIKNTIKPKLKQKKRSFVYSDISLNENSQIGTAMIPNQNLYTKRQNNKHEKNIIINACVTIQRYSRGYLTRKYIEEMKYMVQSIIRIQRGWRGYVCRKNLKRAKKSLSIQNSLITLKDFSEELKQEKIKYKHFQFNLENSQKSLTNKSQQKLVRKKQKEQNEKYLLVLESLLEEEELDQKYKNKIRKTLGKQKYVQNKIVAQIMSEKSFNSSIEVTTPKSNSFMVNSPISWENKKTGQEYLYLIYGSPKSNAGSDHIIKRIISPIQPKPSPKSSNRKAHLQAKSEQFCTIRPFQTNYLFVEEFEYRIIDYLKQNEEKMKNFLLSCQKCRNFRNYTVISQWNQKKNNSEGDGHSFLREWIYPDVFPSSFRQEILSQYPIKSLLQDNNYLEELWLSDKSHKNVYQSFIKCIFDGLTEAIYNNYKQCVLKYCLKEAILYKSGKQLFKSILVKSFNEMQNWNGYMCGAEIPVNELDENFKAYENKNIQRVELMIKNAIHPFNQQSISPVTLWIQIFISEAIAQTLFQEIVDENLI